MTWREYISALKAQWIGTKIPWEDDIYTVVDVDYNGALMIDKPGKFTDTTAVDIAYLLPER